MTIQWSIGQPSHASLRGLYISLGWLG